MKNIQFNTLFKSGEEPRQLRLRLAGSLVFGHALVWIVSGLIWRVFETLSHTVVIGGLAGLQVVASLLIFLLWPWLFGWVRLALSNKWMALNALLGLAFLLFFMVRQSPYFYTVGLHTLTLISKPTDEQGTISEIRVRIQQDSEVPGWFLESKGVDAKTGQITLGPENSSQNFRFYSYGPPILEMHYSTPTPHAWLTIRLDSHSFRSSFQGFENRIYSGDPYIFPGNQFWQGILIARTVFLILGGGAFALALVGALQSLGDALKESKTGKTLQTLLGLGFALLMLAVLPLSTRPLSFNNYFYYVFVGLAVLAYYLLPGRYRPWVLLGATAVFLYTQSRWLAFLLPAVGVSTWWIGKKMVTTEDPAAKKRWLWSGLLLSLGLLAAVKYLLTQEGWADTPVAQILLPLGMSYYIFQVVSTLLDAFRGPLKVYPPLHTYCLYLFFFPEFLAGPIERAGRLVPQFTQEKAFEVDDLVIGLQRIGWGFFKKLLIAGRLLISVQKLFGDPARFSTLETWLGVFFLSIQIYVDFSAYTDIALGVARLFGIRLTENFKRPYFATSVADFWRRWHISFSHWLRDYIFMPLNFRWRKARSRWVTAAVVMITFLVSGIWHGAALTFVVWGLLHGLYQAVELLAEKPRARLRDFLEIKEGSLFQRILQIGFTFFLVSLAWVFFQAPDIPTALQVLRSMFSIGSQGLYFDAAVFGHDPVELNLVLLMLLVLLFVDILDEHNDVFESLKDQHFALRLVVYLLVILVVVVFGEYGTASLDFIYAGF